MEKKLFNSIDFYFEASKFFIIHYSYQKIFNGKFVKN